MKKYSLLSLLGIFSMLLLSSCLKDKSVDNRVYGVDGSDESRIVEIAGDKTYKSFAFDFQNLAITPTIFELRLASNEVSTTDITVTLSTAKSQAMITAYNLANGTNFVPMPASIGTVALTHVIPAGQRSVAVKINTNSINFDPSTIYALGFEIVSVSDPSFKISGNFGSILTSYSAKNRYDGNYEMTFTTRGWAAYGISDNLAGTWPSNADGTSIFMITSGGASVDMFDDWGFGTYIQPAFTTGNAGATGFGATSPRFIFDLATNKLVNVINTTPPDSRNRAFAMNPARTDSRFDPATRTIYAYYLLKQNGRPDQQIDAVLRYVSSRP